MTRLLARFAALISIALPPVCAHAEVMDNEASVHDLWFGAVFLGIAAILAWRWRRWAGLVVTALFVVSFSVAASELADPVVGPLILRESGPGYASHFWGAAITGTALQAAAIGITLVRTGPARGVRRQRARRREEGTA